VKEIKDMGILTSVFGFLSSSVPSSSSSSSAIQSIKRVKSNLWVVLRDGGTRDVVEIDFGKCSMTIVSSRNVVSGLINEVSKTWNVKNFHVNGTVIDEDAQDFDGIVGGAVLMRLEGR